MGPRWKLIVEGLGKIERAEVEVRPLMLFVGENNSGKSYLATLLWGLLTLNGLLKPTGTEATWSACNEWLTRRLEAEGDASIYTLNDDERSMFVRFFNEILQGHTTELIENAFNTKTMRVPRLRIVEPSLADRPPLRFINGFNELSVLKDEDHVITHRVSVDYRYRNDALVRSGILAQQATLSALGKLGGASYSSEAWGSHNPYEPLYLPASRAGFMLLYKAAVRRQIQQLRRTPIASSLDLTLPSITLLDLLAVGLRPEAGPYANEADFLEHSLNGRIELSTDIGVNEYHFRPAGSDSRLSMSLASSLVGELAPVILVLRHMKDFPVLILEEPEAHLHPAMQRHLARTIVRLIRKGLYVWITTHSENFAQQINNFIAIGESPKRADLQKHLGYEEHEYLTHDDISGYQFKLVGDRSEVTELKRRPRGLVMPTFNREIQSLGRETLYLEDETTRDP